MKSEVALIRLEVLAPFMAEPVIAYVRKGCLTCKRALDYMQERGIESEVVDLFQRPLTRERLKNLLQLLGLRPSELLRPRDRMYRELDLKNRHLADEELIELMLRHPGLIKRPIIVQGNRAVVALKPHQVEELLS
ncbi:MAG: arsenate reductase family protein [Thermoplasmata archaeon]